MNFLFHHGLYFLKVSLVLKLDEGNRVYFQELFVAITLERYQCLIELKIILEIISILLFSRPGYKGRQITSLLIFSAFGRFNGRADSSPLYIGKWLISG